MYSKILIPLDGSTAAERVLPYAEEIAGWSGAAVYLISVTETGKADSAAEYQAYLHRAASQLDFEIAAFKTKQNIKIYENVLSGKAAPEIVACAEENNMDLIAMAASGSSGEDDLWPMGHVAAKVLRATSLPVLLVKRVAPKYDRVRGRLLKRVLIPLDGSEWGEGAIPQVEKLAEALEIEAVLLHVLEPMIVSDASGPVKVAVHSEEGEANREREVQAYLGKIGARLRESGVSASGVLRSGSAAAEIITFAEENDIDLIAMSTRGRSGISRWVFGSVTDKVLQASDIPVLAVKAEKR